ncbi:3-oxoacid CoA-transferase subunit B [Rummeliibacillus sp. JY-2-4R]
MVNIQKTLSVQEKIAKRAAEELNTRSIVNLGIGIPTLVAKYITHDEVHFHTENGLLGVTDVDEDHIDPNLVNAGKLPVGEEVGASFFDSAESFGMIRGGHVDVAILGILQVNERGQIANWAVPGKNIMGVGGAMDLLVGAKKVIVTTTHTSKDGKSKILKECTYPITSTRSVDMIITDLAVFCVENETLHLIELMPGIELQQVIDHTEANFVNNLEK